MNENLGERALDHLQEGFQLISFDWRYLYANDAVVKQSKFPREELIGYTMMEKYPGIENTDMFKVLQRSMKERIPEQIENEFTYPDNTKGYFELNIQPVPDGIFILSMDISRRKKAENELKRINESLEEMVALRTFQLESKNKDIMDSLTYAKNIQNAFLPKKKSFHDLFPESLMIYKPKDIVSGDFYFYREMNGNVLLAAGDCTGHGVPGALMSMISIEKLNYAISKSSNPSEILSLLNKGIKVALSQSGNDSKCMDGLDIALCHIDQQRKTVKYSGANRPIWIVRGDQVILEEIKATKQAIGGFTENDQNFETHEIKLRSGDTFYLFSDGYADTFGGSGGKKLTTKKFKELLLEIKHKKMSEQENHLKNFIENWKGDTQQIDDIMVLGVRV